MKKIILTVFALSLFCSLISAQDKAADERAIAAIVNAMQTGWNEKSGEKYASGFAEEHDFIVWNGFYFRNTSRKMTAANHQALFNERFKMADIELRIDKIKFIRPDIAMVHALGVGYEKGKAVPTDPGVLMSILMEKQNEGWKIISFHNLDLEAFENEEFRTHSPIPVEVMYQSWYKK